MVQVEIVLRCRLTGGSASHSGSRGDEQWAVRAGKYVAHRLDNLSVLLTIRYKVREVVIEGTVDDAVRQFRSGPEAFQVFKAPAMHFGSGGDERSGARIRTRQSKYLVSRFDQFRHDRRTDESRSSCDK